MSSIGWNTIESDCGVFTTLVEDLGVSGIEFFDVLSIDPDSLAQFSPLYGIIFLYKYRKSEYAVPREYSETEQDASGQFFFAHQKIQNACATQAILSVLCNLPEGIEIGPILGNFKEFSRDLDPESRGEILGMSDEIRQAHNSFSRPNPFESGDDDRETPDEENDGLYHFVAYVPINGQLWELDGLKQFPVNYGDCTSEQFPEKVSNVLMERVQKAPGGDLRFSVLAVSRDKRDVLKETGGSTTELVVEDLKRKEWTRDNALRRETFVGLINELVKGVVGGMDDEQYKKAIEQGREKTKEMLAKRQ